MWEIETVTTPVARKDYHCEASDWICNASYPDEDYDPEDLETINKARNESWKILKGQKYLKVSGKFEGEFCTFRARIDLEEVCKKYDLYPDC